MDKTKDKKKSSLLIIIVGLFLIICILGSLIFKFALDNSLLDLDFLEDKASLKYTETNNNIKEGIYITDVSDIVSDVMPSIVSITSKTLISNGFFNPSFWGGNSYAEGAGSGIIVSETDDEILILTNNHVVADATELNVQFIDDESVDATIKGTNESRDLAVISVKQSDLKNETKEKIKIATIGDSTKLQVGDGVIAIGNALGYGQSVTTGVVSALEREITIDNYTNKMIQIDAAINGGNSGGALLNSNGEVVGINSAKYSSSGSNTSVEGMGFAIPISDVDDLIEDLINGKETDENVSSNIKLGVEGKMINSGFITGFYISNVEKNSIASKNNLKAGDIIVEIDNNEVTSTDTITNVLKNKKTGDDLQLIILYQSGRQYLEKEINIKID